VTPYSVAEAREQQSRGHKRGCIECGAIATTILRYRGTDYPMCQRHYRKYRATEDELVWFRQDELGRPVRQP
jgi:hypothetical protein